MRLKIFLTPLAFLVAVVVSIWYIWPAAMNIQLKMDEVKISQENLNTTLEKKNNVAILADSLDKNKDKEEFILKFIPSSKDEEKIVNGLNYLASDSGVSLFNVSMKDDKVSEKPVASDLTTPEQSRDASSTMPAIKFALVNIAISGKYENIKIFLSQLHKMEIINKINSLSILKATGDDTGGDILTANLEIKFGYMPYINQAGNNLSAVFSKSNFNFDSYSKINELVSQKIPVLDAGQKGKANPFLP